MNRVTFDYAFGAPHTLTLSRPSASDKIPVRVSEDGMEFNRTYDSQLSNYPLAWKTYPMDICTVMNLSVDLESGKFSRWYRHESGAPYLFAEGDHLGVSYTVSAVSAKSGVIIKIAARNETDIPRDLHVQFALRNIWVVSNRGWMDGVNNNLLLTMSCGRADRIVALGLGADEYPMYYHQGGGESGQPPMSNESFPIAPDSSKKITSLCRLGSGETKTCYILLPHEAYFGELETVKQTDLEGEMGDALAEWTRLLSRSAKLTIDDDSLLHAFRACLADLFVMRERVGRSGYMGIANGTNLYRSTASGEPLQSEILLESLGYIREAVKDYPVYLDGQDPDGCWVTVKGWEHDIWGLIYNKAHAVMHHYAISRDRNYLEKYYPRMLASTRFDMTSREQTRKDAAAGKIPAYAYGLMPRGMGDCGMQNGADYYGYFYPHNCRALAGDYLTLEAAEILGKVEDIPYLTDTLETAKRDLLASIRNNAVQEDGYVRVPALAGVPDTSSYGCLYACFPAAILPPDDPLMTGTVRHIESKQKSEGGLPMGTGWLRGGLWVAMALNNFARAYLRMGLYREARAYLYPAVNHASPFVTWCEERGPEPGSPVKTGDEQHLWTPLSVLQYMTDMLYFEDADAIHLFSGILPEWLEEGKPVAVKGLRTALGKTDLSLSKKGNRYIVQVKAERVPEQDMILHIVDSEGVDHPVNLPREARVKMIVTL